MISARLLNNTLRELHEIMGSDITLINRSSELIANFSNFDSSLLILIRDFLDSAADTMTMEDRKFTKIFDEEKLEFILITGGENADLTARLAKSELTNLLILSHERTDKNRFIHNVLLDNLLPVDLRDDARKLKIRDDVYRVVYLVETSEENNSIALQTLRAIYTNSGSNAFVTSLDIRHIAVVVEVEDSSAEHQRMKIAYTLSDSLNTEAMIKVRVAYGEPKIQLAHLSQSYKEAQLAMEVGKIFYPDRHVLSYSNLGIGRLIYQLPASLCELFLKETFDHDIFSELDDETMTTIRHFFENNLNISETARQLYIHRNTLVYRLEKLQKLTGLDIRKFDEAMTFKIAMMVDDYLKNKEE